MTFDDDVSACGDAVHKHDPLRFQAVMASPVAVRPFLFSLYAFNIELARAPWASQESMIAEMRVQWWRDVGSEIAAGTGVRRHYVATPLARLLRADLAHHIDTMAEARRWDIYRDPFEDQTALDAYIDATAGGVMWMAAATLGAAAHEEKAVRDFAYGAGLATYLQAIPELVTHKRIPLLDGTHAGLRELARNGRAKIAAARKNGVTRLAVPALLTGWQADAILAQVERQPERVEQGALGLSEFHKRSSLMLRAMTGRW